ncbi:MAG: Rrf2 family transcriptional regulator [Deltaproteobacteria bacterium]|nr:Rrf2 family transcriptional regulator [Deltaproteobacteria bacterium]
MLSQQTKYALRALIYLKNQPAEQFVKVEQIAQDADLPAAYLSKILKQLTNGKLLLSRRGTNGGVQFDRRNRQVTFHAICEAVDDPIVREECVLFKKACNKNMPCPFHKTWSKSKEQLLAFLKATSIEKM